jgi:hypothetical protein
MEYFSGKSFIWNILEEATPAKSRWMNILAATLLVGIF